MESSENASQENISQQTQQIQQTSNQTTENGVTGNQGNPGDAQQCPVCLEDLPNDNFVRYRRCVHALCRGCYSNWSTISNRCPVCRTLIDDEDALLRSSLERLNTSLNSAFQEMERLRTLMEALGFKL